MAVCHWWSRLLSAQSGLWLVSCPWPRPLIGCWPQPGHSGSRGRGGWGWPPVAGHLRCHTDGLPVAITDQGWQHSVTHVTPDTRYTCQSPWWQHSVTRVTCDSDTLYTCLESLKLSRHVTRDGSQHIIASDWWRVARARVPAVSEHLDNLTLSPEPRVHVTSATETTVSAGFRLFYQFVCFMNDTIT